MKILNEIRNLILSGVLALLAGFVSTIDAKAPLAPEIFAAAKKRPNIILIMADDLGWGDVRCFNQGTPIQTPHLDSMAAAGIQFNRFYSSSPVCSPTRGSCMTGRYPFRYGIYYANTGYMKTEELTLPELLRKQGYNTGHFGKWHLGTLTTTIQDANRGKPGNLKEFSPPQVNGFDVCFSTESKVPTWDPMLKRSGESSKTCWNYIKNKSTAVHYGTHYWNEKGEIVRDNLEGDNSRIIMDRVIPFIKQSVEENEPFFSVVWFHTPHLPVVAGPKYAAMYDQYDEFEKNYYGCITAMDEQIGRLRATLREHGVADNTMIWFCSDNGPEGKNADENPGTTGNFRGRKRSLYEGGVRVPGILEWPARVQPGMVSDFPVVTSDYLPTILDEIGVELPDKRPVDGISLLPMLDGKMTKRSLPIGFESREQLSWVTQQYKLYSGDVGKTWEFYDLLADPYERDDIAARNPKRVKRFKKQLMKWRASCAVSDSGKDY